MIKRRKRATLLIILISITAVSIYLILWALRDNIVFFYSPTEIYEKVRSGEILKIEKLPNSKSDTKVEFKDILA